MRGILERALANGTPAEGLLTELDPASKRILTAALAGGEAIADPARQLRDLVTRLRNRHLDRRLTELTRLTAQPNLPEAELMRVLEEQKNLRAQKQEALPPVEDSA